MQTIEIIGFLLFSIIVAGLILSFFFGIDFTKIQQSITNAFMQKPELEKFQKLTLSQLLGRMNACWQQCGFGEEFKDCGTILLTDEGITTEQKTNGLADTDFTYFFQQMNYCTKCDINYMAEPIKPPAIIHITCDFNDNNKLALQ